MADPITHPATPQALFGKEAVVAALQNNVAIGALGDMLTDAKWDRLELTLTVAPENIVAGLQALKEAGYNAFDDVTAVDWYPAEPRFQLSYSLLSHRLKNRIRVIARLSGDDPVIDSVTPVWAGANFFEREVFDLFGIRFAGHPRLTRIMMPDNWNGHPLRKDYPVEGYR